MSSIQCILAAAAVAVVLTACGSDPRAANNGNFERAINARLASGQGKLCVATYPATLPYRSLVNNPSSYMQEVPEDIHRPDPATIAKLEAMVGVHLASKVGGTASLTETKYGTNFQPIKSTVRVPMVTYEHGAEFAKYVGQSSSVATLLVGTMESLCFASLVVDHVENFSAPGQMMGATVSSVYYRANVVDVAPWATDAAMRQAFPSIQTDLEQATQQRAATVVLMSDGWQAQ